MSAKDDADLASEQEEIARLEALHQVHHTFTFRTGSCYNCGEPIPGSFCDVECREDWERRQAYNHKTRSHL